MAKGTGLTEGQRESLAVLAKSDRRLDTNSVSFKAGHRYGRWAYGKLKALEDRGLAISWLPDRVTLATWSITDLGRAALAERGGAAPSPTSPVAKDERHGEG